jgi:ABC-type Fe3+ transport system permease subunit
MPEEVIKKTTIVANGKDTELSALYTWISVNLDVIYKLVFFTAALFAFPILTFFITLHSLFEGKEESKKLYLLINQIGNTSYAAGASAVVANIVVLLYIITAYFEKPKEKTE